MARLLSLKHQKKVLWKKYCATRDCLGYQRYTSARNSLRSVTHPLRMDYKKKVAVEAKSNPKRFWKYVNSKLEVLKNSNIN